MDGRNSLISKKRNVPHPNNQPSQNPTETKKIMQRQTLPKKKLSQQIFDFFKPKNQNQKPESQTKEVAQSFIEVKPTESEQQEMSQATNLIWKSSKRQDLIEASQVLQRLAEKGIIEACWKIAACYIKGIGVEKNPEKGQKYSKIAMNAGSLDGLFWFARSFEMDGDFKKMKEAKHKGHLAARWWVGCYQYHGVGCKQNQSQGRENMLKVASSGDLYWERIHHKLIKNNSFDFSAQDLPQDADKKGLDMNIPFDSDCSIFKPGFDGFDEVVQLI
jgi:TPR repeat protein